MKPIPILLAAVVIMFASSRGTAADPLAQADRMVAQGRTITFYDSSATKVGTLAVPYPGTGSEAMRDITQLADGRLAVFNGIFNPYLSIYDFNTGTWTHTQFTGWSATNNTRFGGIASLGNFVFLSDDNTSGSGSVQGSIRYDLQTGTFIRYDTTYGTHDVNVGLDGLVYSLGRAADPAQQVMVYDPYTLTRVRAVTFQTGSIADWQPNSVAADAAGRIYIGNNSRGAIHVFNPDGSWLRTISTGINYVRDLDLRGDGSLMFGTFFEGVFQSDPSQTVFKRLGTTSDGYTSFFRPLLSDNGSLGNLVWFDANRNGLVDPGEPGIPGVAVRLYTPAQTPGVDSPVAITVTDAGGAYSFPNLIPGSYVVYVPVPPYSAPSLSQVQNHNDDQIDNDNNGGQLVFGGPVRSLVITIATSENDPTVDFGFTCYGPWQEWQHRNPLGGKNQPGDNPDGDNHVNLIEFAFNLPPDNGTGSPFSIKPSTSPTGRVEIGFNRPVGATASAKYYLEYSGALGTAASWIPIPLATISPRNIDIAAIDDLTEHIAIRNFEAREGFVRFRVELDANGDGIIDHISYTGVDGWTESAMELGTRTHNTPYQNSTVFAGTVDASGVSGQTLRFSTSAGAVDLGTVLTPGASYYLEVTAGDNEGHRFDVVSATGNTVTLATDSDVVSDNPPFSTRAGALPANLVNDRIAIHRHWTLGEVFPVGRFHAGGDDTTADQVQTSAVAATNTYWLYSNSGSPKWIKLGDATLADQGSTVLAPGRGLMVIKRGAAVPVLACGEVRSNKFIRPLRAGSNLVGGGWPIAQSAAGTGGRQMDVAHGFTGSTDPANADTFSIWHGDATPGATGYDNYYLYNPGTSPKWVKAGDPTLTSCDADPLFPGDRGVLIQMKNNLYGYTMPNPMAGTSLNIATQGAAAAQGLADTGVDPGAVSDLIAYAFGLQPGSNNPALLPQGKLAGGNYVIEFTEPSGVTGITYGAECSTTLLPDSWTEVPDTGTGSEHIFSVPAAAGGKLFMRLKVTNR